MGKATKKLDTIAVTDIGPVKYAEIPYDPDGGVIELRGGQGAGKSTTLRAIENLATGKGKLPVRDRAKSGTVDGLGMLVKVGARTTRTGAPLVVSLEGKLSIADLVDPGIANADAADARRIKALIQLAGVGPDINLFNACLGELDRNTLSPETIDADDLLGMQERVKRDLEAAARKAEDRAENARGRVQALRAASTGDETPPGEEWTAETAQAELEGALGDLGRVRQKIVDDQRRWEAASKARKSLADARAGYRGISAAGAEGAVAEAKKRAEARRQIVANLRAELAEAEKELGLATDRQNTAELELLRAQEHTALTAAWERDIAGGEDCPDSPDDQLLADATAAVDGARKLVADVAVRDKMADQLREAKEQERAAVAATREALALREAAKGTDQVLSDAVAGLGTKLYVEAGRLLFDTARGPTFFGELSDGERARIVIEIAIDQAAKLSDAERLGIFVIPQSMWSELQPANRAWTRARCKERRVLAYAALATDDDELTAEVL